MSTAVVRGRRNGRSIGAVIAGIAIVIVLSVGTDIAMRAAGLFPALNEPMGDNRLFWLRRIVPCTV